MRRIGSVVVLAAAVVSLAVGCASQATPGSQPELAVSRPATAATCPAALPADTTTFRFPTAPTSTLVPGTPDRATVCRYQGLDDPHPRTLDRHADLDAAQATRLATAFDKTKVWPKNTRFPCPADFGANQLVEFGYPNQGPVDVIVSATGCTPASNGHRDTLFAGDAVRQIDAVVGAPTPAHS
jgi:hypothetical protein